MDISCHYNSLMMMDVVGLLTGRQMKPVREEGLNLIRRVIDRYNGDLKKRFLRYASNMDGWR